ncbi:putative M20 family peptidase [Microlunatus phosphovorus NM-1]|uniref:Putative M20 family peptidase n=1 Tax=Microlunatus phosphovorus (strain ATCC 700054 / DSM 10555 / JCM 9379 / NBRC 101784 / NCIMB 13414 / VKM Ac-1990 / NM-1) TaxID=1032480 RepID=F5XPL0_MICPN|nr:amidohydrolase [Microlunatus phosphovorus]BAK34318.1 putative M20 family peptidase [Microlunatus phosphovorus NM-1]
MQVQTSTSSRLQLITEETNRLYEDLVALRRDIHAHPEVGHEEYRTTQLVVDTLARAGLHAEVLSVGTGAICDILPSGSGSGSDADADSAGGPRQDLVGLRADLDALPITDGKNVPYRSRTDGICHACGHDVHTTIVLGTGLVLARLRDQGLLHRGVRLIFQPAEETSPGGALDAIASGALEGVSEVYALHCDPRTEVGKIAHRVGPITSAVDQVVVTVTGSGGHTSRPHLTADVIGALGAVATETQLLLSRRVDPRSGLSLMWGRIHAGSAPNAIPQVGVIEGTLRALDEDGWRKAQALLGELVSQIVAPFGAGVEVSLTAGVPPAVNHQLGVERLSEAARSVLGPEGVAVTDQSLGGEDFAWMLQQVPGAMARLGVRPQDQDLIPDIHQPAFDVDERCIRVGVATLAAVASRPADDRDSGVRG